MHFYTIYQNLAIYLLIILGIHCIFCRGAIHYSSTTNGAILNHFTSVTNKTNKRDNAQNMLQIENTNFPIQVSTELLQYFQKDPTKRFLRKFKIVLSNENQLDEIKYLLDSDSIRNKQLIEEWDSILKEIQNIRMKERLTWARNYLGSSQSNNETKPEFIYHSNDDIAYLLKRWSSLFPHVELQTAGKSSDGEDVWYIVVRGKRPHNILRPAIKYIGNIHGDEVVGRELLLHFAYDIITNYCCAECGDVCKGTSHEKRVTQLLDTADFFLIPSMNPDAYKAGSRYNKYNVDVNRNFPDQYHDPNDSLENRQIETKNLIQFIKAFPFVLSASFHGGAVVANYPFDGTKDGSKSPNPCPDDLLFKQISLAYSKNHETMHRSSEFPNGVIQGSMWYPLYGGMQDYNYLWNSILEVTIEVSNIKQPPESTIAQFWEENKNAMLAFAEEIYQGVYGTVMTEEGSFPLKAKVHVEEFGKDVATHPRGEFYKLLPPGDYTLTFSSEGYVPKSVRVSISKGKTTFVDVALKPGVFRTDSTGGHSRRIGFVLSLLLGAFALIYIFLVILLKFIRKRRGNHEHFHSIPLESY